MPKIKINTYESNPEWDNMEIEQNWNISSHANGDVEIECTTENGSEYLFLNQDELKQFIAFLQTKVK
ncbi:MAG: hypothetical protein LLG05_03325 [Porphyromonadaceae bacterium]|nr:hypothetical protein [Porphyromonadaceae bacterium]